MKKKKNRCHACGKEADFKAVNPYLEELFPEDENEEEWWCEECYQEKGDDI